MFTWSANVRTILFIFTIQIFHILLKCKFYESKKLEKYLLEACVLSVFWDKTSIMYKNIKISPICWN